jgi:tRNA dimethylallyltransferase
MSDNVFHRAIYLTGPTASGKTAIGAALARELDAEILALDSMTLYRGMDIGTAKPTPFERCGIAHHLIDVINPWESASVSAYREWAAKSAREIEARGKRTLFVGGTPLYLKALLRGLFAGPGGEQELRQRLEREAIDRGDAALHGRLALYDPKSAARLHPHDRRRIIRALEILELTGRPMSELQAEHDRPAPENVPVLALDLPRTYLHDRINSRVMHFFESGLVEEVRRLQSAARPMSGVAAQAIGYREVIDMLVGNGSVTETIEQIQARTRQFAKRQGTWFRGLAEVRSVAVEPDEPPEAIAVRILPLIESGKNLAGGAPTDSGERSGKRC